ncbi:MAG: hypothetical protein HQL78_10935, partial [Magnetococcales bacterium]|nr:hypothetical protein [Magnetococcales bacterium]
MALLLRAFALVLFVLTFGSAQAAEPEAFVPKEGIDYATIANPVPAPAGKPEIVEVFNFKCPHCYDLHPHLEAWQKASGGEHLGIGGGAGGLQGGYAKIGRASVGK